MRPARQSVWAMRTAVERFDAPCRAGLPSDPHAAIERVEEEPLMFELDHLASDGRQHYVAEAVLYDRQPLLVDATVRSRFTVARLPAT